MKVRAIRRRHSLRKRPVLLESIFGFGPVFAHSELLPDLVVDWVAFMAHLDQEERNLLADIVWKGFHDRTLHVQDNGQINAKWTMRFPEVPQA